MAGTVRKVADGWVADVTVNGTRRTGKCKTRAEALARKRELLELLLQREAKPNIGPAHFTLAEARELSLRVRWAGTAYERTAAIYSRHAVEHFGRYFRLCDVTAVDVDKWRQALLAKGNRPSTVNRKVSALRAMLADAHLQGHISDMPRMPQRLRVVNTKDRVITDEERQAFCQYFIKIGEPAAADLFVFLLETVCRWGEAERLKAQDVGLTGRRLTFWKTKNGTSRSIKLTAKAVEVLSANMPAVKSHRIWPYSYDRFDYLFTAAKQAIGLGEDKQLTIHTTRHTGASKMARRGVPLQKIMEYGGWTSLEAVKRYMHLDIDSQDECIEALED